MSDRSRSQGYRANVARGCAELFVLVGALFVVTFFADLFVHWLTKS